MIKITQKGLNKVIQSLDPSKMVDSITETIEEAANIAYTDAWIHCPVYSGDMREAIETEIQSDSFSIKVDYSNGEFDVAHMNEYGKSPYWNIGTMEDPTIYVNELGNTGYHPFVRPAVLKAAKKFPEIFGQKWYHKRG